MIKIAFSFDDGRKDNYIVAKEILEPLNLKATFNITTGYILNTNEFSDNPSAHCPMSLDELKYLNSCNLFEIAGHGYKHNNNQDNLIIGVIELRKILNSDDIVGIASPHSEFDVCGVDSFKSKCDEEKIKYLRISHNFEKNVIFNKVLRKVNRLFHIPFIYSFVYKDSYVRKGEFLLRSVGVVKDNRLEEVEHLIEYAIKTNKSYILMMHSILNAGEEYYDDLFSWDYEDFKKLCLFLKKLENEGKLEICQVKEMVDYD